MLVDVRSFSSSDDLFDNEETGIAFFIESLPDLDGSRCSFPQLEEVIPESQTPRTDAEYGGSVDGMISLQFAKQLEQELAQSLAREQQLRDNLEDIRTILNK